MSKTTQKQKCSYCRRSKLADEQFEWILMSFFSGYTAEITARIVDRLFPTKPPLSEKAVRRYYKKIGTVLFDRFLRPLLLRNQSIVGLQVGNPTRFDSRLNELLVQAHHEFLLEKNNVPLNELQKEFPTVMMIYRKLSASKNGVRGSVNEHMALSIMLYAARIWAREDRLISAETSDLSLATLVSFWLDEFRRNPC